MYTDMFSCVKGRGYKSAWFPVRQGTRQGGVISPFLYLIFINEVLYDLEAAGLGFCLYGISCGFPTVADDMLVGSYSVAGLEEMLQFVIIMQKQWHFEYGIVKCLVIVFNELKNAYLQSSRTWNFGKSCIEEGTEYKHLGVICDKYMSIDENVK